MMSAADWIRILNLVPHPEGGFYREVYRSAESIPKRALPPRYGGPRAFSTSIYFLLRSGQVSRFHRLKSDEVWHFYAGSPLFVHAITDKRSLRLIRMGRDPRKGEVLQAVVPAGSWFGAEVALRRAYSLVGCTLAPGFDFADFELGRRGDLLARFPRHRAIIERLNP